MDIQQIWRDLLTWRTDLPFEGLLKFVGDRNSPLTVFDLETTQKSPHYGGFRIIEFGLVHISVDLRVGTASRLVDPQIKIPRSATEISGISDSDVAGQPIWKHWALMFHWIAGKHITVGYNSVAFDCPAVSVRNLRNDVEGTEFTQHVDLFGLPQIGKRKLEVVAQEFGVEAPENFHRALDDAIVTAKLMEHVLAMKPEPVLLQPRPVPRFEKLERPKGVNWQTRRKQILEHIAGHSEVDVEAFAKRFGVSNSAIESDLFALVDKGSLSLDHLANEDVQRELDTIIAQAMSEAWDETNKGRLKPLMLWLQENSSCPVDYFQLRICLKNAGIVL